jgi:hypothetical protein
VGETAAQDVMDGGRRPGRSRQVRKSYQAGDAFDEFSGTVLATMSVGGKEAHCFCR